MKICRAFTPRTVMKLRSWSSYSRYVFLHLFHLLHLFPFHLFLNQPLSRPRVVSSLRKISVRETYSLSSPLLFLLSTHCTLHPCARMKKREKTKKLAQTYCSKSFFTSDFSSRAIFLLFLSPNLCKSKITIIRQR